ncbi:hypothetical protein BDR06DRAFT_885033, partial [Suillus hirtellus]
WASIKQSNLNWITKNQKKLRVDCYQGLADNILNDGTDDLAQTGHSIILSSLHTGSPYYMHQLLQNSLAICHACKKPDLFLTMTENGSWPEIIENLLPGQSAVDRPDLVACIFYQKQQVLLKKVHKGYYRKVAGLVYTIKYQKCGLPHMHLLIFLDSDHKIRTAE